ncbi:MAG: hypothetical protein EOR99_31135 [Mesorhizobium sp.]|nr:MAG: hypothetical protein EOR99_31135 [Mesorhizobium sp.]
MPKGAAGVLRLEGRGRFSIHSYQRLVLRLRMVKYLAKAVGRHLHVNPMDVLITLNRLDFNGGIAVQ